MFIGVGRFELFIPDSRSLKQKRSVVRSAIAGVANRFNVSIAEVAYQDLWQRTAVGVACVSGSTVHCRQILQEVERAIARSIVGGAEIVDRELEVVALEDLV